MMLASEAFLGVVGAGQQPAVLLRVRVAPVSQVKLVAATVVLAQGRRILISFVVVARGQGIELILVLVKLLLVMT